MGDLNDFENRVRRLQGEAEALDSMGLIGKVEAAPQLFRDAQNLIYDLLTALREARHGET